VKPFQLRKGKNRAIRAYIPGTDITAAAHTDAALHAPFKRDIDALLREAQPAKHREGKIDHHPRTAHKRHRIPCRGGESFHHVGNISGKVAPPLLWAIDGLVQGNILTLVPGGYIRFVEKEARIARPEYHGEGAVLGPESRIQ